MRLLQWPQGPGIRVDAGVAEGSVVSPHYDPLLAKIIAWGEDREQARRRLLAALDELVLLGVQHNQAYLHQLLADEAFVGATMDTTTLATITPVAPPAPPAELCAELCVQFSGERGADKRAASRAGRAAASTSVHALASTAAPSASVWTTLVDWRAR